MNRTHPPPKRKRACYSAPPNDLPDQREYAPWKRLQAGWAREGRRILREWHRTGREPHLRAFLRHRAAMGGRARSEAIKGANFWRCRQ